MTVERKREIFLHLPCRHHTFELPLGSLVEAEFGRSTGPEVQGLRLLKDRWESLSKY